MRPQVNKATNKKILLALAIILFVSAIGLYYNTNVKIDKEGFTTADETKYPDMAAIYKGFKNIKKEVENINKIFQGSDINADVKAFLNKDKDFETMLGGFSMGESALNNVIKNIKDNFPV